MCAVESADGARRLIITADDYGYWPSYNEGILAAVEAGAVDSVSAMIDREYCDPEPLLESGVEVGLHIEFEGRWGSRSAAPARTSLRVQVERFVDLFRRWPAYLDGHKHCHARPELATPVLQMAEQIKGPVRSLSDDHRQWLRERGVPTPDLLLGRTRSSDQAEPERLRELPPGVTEWMSHPGYPDPDSGSEYDLARREDLDELLRARVRERFDTPIWGTDVLRTTHKEAFAYEGGALEEARAEGRELREN
jgi:predicted glycoside hydrolase/deacetylase ChbG (UPF0249 family)